jgi:VanZ family protein
MKHFWKIALAVWIVAICAGSLWPLSGPVMPGGDKIQHLLGYAGLAFLAAQAFRPRPAVWLFASSIGILLEFAQALTPWRSFEVADMLANALGALLGLLAALLWRMFFLRNASSA